MEEEQSTVENKPDDHQAANGKQQAQKRPADDATLISTNSNLPRSVLSGWGNTRFSEQSQIVIYVKGVEKPIVIDEPQDEMKIGRGSAVMPALNLAPYNAATKGVSRVHAAFRRDYEEDTLTLVDLGSTNGTFLNEEQLSPNMPYPLRDGDTIRFGKLVIHIYFK